MNFLDTITVRIKSGDGGNGCISFRREKYVPRGGPDGGDGGKGGDVIFRGDKGKHTLLDLRYKKEYNAKNGQRGGGQNKTGKSGDNLVVLVPFGTMLFDDDTGELLIDISEETPEYLAAHGGRGGRGNSAFVSSTHRAPRTAEPGTPGEECTIRLELKLIADVGIVGYPNAGKSTFIATVSAARPKVADYPFTTLTPVLGVVQNKYGGTFVIADMPGLIEGASEGIGLGHRFLRHIERTSLLLHFVDSSLDESMIERYKTIRNELVSYSEEVSTKPEVVVATKIDSVIEENLEEFEKYIKKIKRPFFKISSISRNGLPELLEWIEKTLKEQEKAREEAGNEKI